jgi:hypothetical protein
MQDAVRNINDGACKTMVHEYQKLAAQDIRFDVPLAEACRQDRTTYCGKVPPVSNLTTAWHAGNFAGWAGTHIVTESRHHSAPTRHPHALAHAAHHDAKGMGLLLL